MNRNPLTLPELLYRIDRYFDCTLSDEEERELRSAIANTPFSHPAIDEARALMGFRRLPETAKNRHRNSGGTFRTVISIAAALALIITIGIHLYNSPSLSPTVTDDGTCIAYVNGCCITDEADVVKLMIADLREFESGADDIQASIGDELSDLAKLIQSYETDFPDL